MREAGPLRLLEPRSNCVELRPVENDSQWDALHHQGKAVGLFPPFLTRRVVFRVASSLNGPSNLSQQASRSSIRDIFVRMYFTHSGNFHTVSRISVHVDPTESDQPE